MVLLGAHSYHCSRPPLFKLNNKWMVRNNKNSKKVIVLICDNNIKLHEAQLYMFFHAGYAVILCRKNQVHGWESDWHHPFTHSGQKCNLFCNKLIQYIFYNIWGLSTHLQVFNNCSSCTCIIQCRVTPLLFIEKAFKVIVSHLHINNKSFL